MGLATQMNGKVLVVEDDRPLARMLEQEIRAAGHEVEIVHSGSDALARIEWESFDLVVLDLTLPDVDGIEVAERIGHEGPGILMLTARADVDSRVKGLYAGAADYVTKPFDLDELMARVHVRLRERLGPDDTLRIGRLEIQPSAGAVSVGGTPVGLTARELALLAMLARHRGRVFAKADLEARLYGPDGPESNTIEVFISNVRRKLARAGIDGVIETVRGLGYVIRRP